MLGTYVLVYSCCEELFKCYFLLITCAAIRAVHIELISDFSSNSLILALFQCFDNFVIISRRLKL